jgi:hypothetical protein
MDSSAPGPCVLQSPTVSELNELNFWCVEFKASSDIVVVQLAVTSGVSILDTRNVTTRFLNSANSDLACIPLPTAKDAVYGVQLSAATYLSSSAEWVEVSYFRLSTTDSKTICELSLFDFVYYNISCW